MKIKSLLVLTKSEDKNTLHRHVVKNTFPDGSKVCLKLHQAM